MIRSLPQLLVAIHDRKKPGNILLPKLDAQRFVPAYRVGVTSDITQEARAAAVAVSHLADRLHRLNTAYGAWEDFEPGPFFDFYPEQVRALCSIIERQQRVHITVYADLLLPSFRAAVHFWATSYYPAVQAVAVNGALHNGHRNGLLHYEAQATLEWSDYLRDELNEMKQRLMNVQQILRETIRHLQAEPDVSFLASWGALEERQRHAVYLDNGPEGMWPRGLPLPQQSPTLTLETAFPLPPRRRPQRRKALRRWRQRKLSESIAR